MHYVLTATEASLAATATISAQETTPGHSFSTSDLASSMTSYPLTELLFCRAFFSLVIEGLSSSKIDASQPCKHKRALRYKLLFKMNGIISVAYSCKLVPEQSNHGNGGGLGRLPSDVRVRLLFLWMI